MGVKVWKRTKGCNQRVTDCQKNLNPCVKKTKSIEIQITEKNHLTYVYENTDHYDQS